MDLTDLEDSLPRIWETAVRLGLDPFPTHFEVVPAAILYEFGAYGLPGRFSHWTFGKAYHRMKTYYDYGLSKIYELVINANPAQAFLLDTNSTLQNKFVMAHVLGHADFFKNNAYFQETSREMVVSAVSAAERLRRYEAQYGRERVESLLDAALSLSHHVSAEAEPHYDQTEGSDNPFGDLAPPVARKPRPEKPPRSDLPTRDVLGFLAAHSTILQEWERDVLTVVRQESLYFMPQMRTKIMNEGWASYWHLRILRELPLSSAEAVDFARMHSMVAVPHPLDINPYFVGLKMFEDIAEKLGEREIFRVREVEDDVSFLRNYLNESLVRDLDLYQYARRNQEWVVEDTDWEVVRDRLVAVRVHMGIPWIDVAEDNYRNSGQILLNHHHEGEDLDRSYAEKTLGYVERLWGRPVYLRTVLDGREVTLTSSS